MQSTRPAATANPAIRKICHFGAALSATLMLNSIGLATASPSQPIRLAQQEAGKTVDFAIAELPMSEALTALGAQSGLTIIVETKFSKGVKSTALRGSYTPEEALKKLLTPVGLKAEYLDSKTVAIRLASDADALISRSNNSSVLLRLAQDNQTATTETQNSGQTSEQHSGEQHSSSAEHHSGSAQRAEDDTKVIPEILVKGSRSLNMDIQRSRDDAQPYVVFDREKIKQSGATSLEGFLRDRLTMNNNGLAAGQRVTQIGTQSSFNLRGLGATQTLILIDGRRSAPGPSTGASPRQSDINGIPMSAVERIEVLPATASGIYGGSATGGVINIVLRRDYQQSEVKLSYGNTLASDAASRRVDISKGFTFEEGRSHLMVIGSYSDENPLTLGERPELVERYYNIARANAPATLLPPNNPPLGSTPNIRSANGSNLILKSDLTPLGYSYTHVPVGYAGLSSGDGGRALVANAGKYNYELADSLQSVTGSRAQISSNPLYASLRATLHREFSERIRGFFEVSGTTTETIAPSTTSSGSFTNPYRVAAGSATNPFTTDIIVTVPSPFEASLKSYLSQGRATAGVVVSLPGRWQLGADYTWARTRYAQGGFSNSSNGADTAAVLNGTVNVVRDTNLYPVDLMSYQTITPWDGSQYINFGDAVVRLSGSLFNLPAGPVGLSALLEHRKESYSDLTSVNPGLVIFAPSRSARVASAYLETRIPFVSAKNARPGIQSLELQLAGRADEYRTHGKTGFIVVGSNTPIVAATNTTQSINPTVALLYQPLQDISLRASYGTGFVAPDVSQLASSVSLSTVTVSDPRRNGASTVIPVGGALQGGNPNLEPEESESFSAGFMLTPRTIPGLRLSVDYIHIKKSNNIANYPTGVQGLVNDEALFPNRIRRADPLPGDPVGTPGPINFIDATLFNVATAEIEAYDLQLDYTVDTPVGAFALATVASRQTHYKTRSLAGQPTVDNVGIAYTNPQGFTGNTELSWRHRGWIAGWTARYYDDYYTANPTLVSSTANITLQGNGGRVPSQMYHDLFIGWNADSAQLPTRLLENTEVQLNVRNIFDKLPPFDANIYTVLRTYHSPLGDPLGTNWRLSVTRRF